MTKEEAKAFLDKIGVKVDELTDELVAKVEAYRATLAAETRRSARQSPARAYRLAFALGVGVGYLFWG